MTATVTLTPSERALMVRLAASDQIWNPSSARGARIGTTSAGWTAVNNREFSRLEHFQLVEPVDRRPHGVFYAISDTGKTWCAAHGIELAVPIDPDRARVAVTLQPVCKTPVPFTAAPDVCGNCGNLLEAHFGKPDPVATERINAAMWQVMIALGGPYTIYGGGVDTMTAPMFREHMNVCTVDLDASDAPSMDRQVLFTDTYDDTGATTEILSGRMTCGCNRYTNETIAVDHLTLGQLIWHATHLHDNQGL